MMVAVLGATLAFAGCAATGPPDVIAVTPGGYDEAFEAAIDAGRQAGFHLVVRDMRRGVIETNPDTAASLLEPWRGISELENTIAHQRRWARFQFVPVAESPDERDTDQSISPPDLLATGEPPPDLTGYRGPMELHVQVFLERAFAPGLRRSTWARRMSSQTTITRGEDEPPPSSFWAPIGRDPAFEASLRQAVVDRLAN